MSLTITSCKNGSYFCVNEEGQPEAAFECMETEHGEIECFVRLLYYITEYFGMLGSKHDAKRIRITTGGEDD